MAHRWRPSSTLTWNRLRRSYWLGAVRPRWRCCSTEAGSVSPWVTMMRRRLARYSPGTSCQAFSPLWSEMDLAVLLGRVEEDAPAVVGHLDVTELRPALRIDADGRAQVHIKAMAAVRAHVVPPVQVVGLPLLERPLQGAVFGQVDVVGDLFAVIDRGHACLQVSGQSVNQSSKKLTRFEGCGGRSRQASPQTRFQS